MTLRWLIATIHLLALPLGLGAIWARSRALGLAKAVEDLRRVFVLWLGTGLLRAFAGLEKGASYYLHDRVFYVKMALFVTILILEIWPMATLIRWRISVRRGAPVDLTSAPTLARLSQIQLGLVVLIVFAATALARGFFY